MIDCSPDKIWYLSRCRIFDGLNDEEYQRLALQSDPVTCQRGDSIVWSEKEDDVVYVIKKGSVKIVTQQPGSRHETILALLGPGELFGQMPHVERDPRPCQAVALEETYLCEFLARDIERMMLQRPEMTIRITKMMGLRLRRIETRVSQLLFKDSRQRVAFLLLELEEQWGRAHAGGGRAIELRLTHQDIANLAGLTRETVSLTLAEFELDELIRTAGRKIIVPARTGLQAIVESTPARSAGA